MSTFQLDNHSCKGEHLKLQPFPEFFVSEKSKGLELCQVCQVRITVFKSVSVFLFGGISG